MKTIIDMSQYTEAELQRVIADLQQEIKARAKKFNYGDVIEISKNIAEYQAVTIVCRATATLMGGLPLMVWFLADDYTICRDSAESMAKRLRIQGYPEQFSRVLS